jgi:2,3-bisphosphoglycerate-independent phosphoglycerate mutase
LRYNIEFPFPAAFPPQAMTDVLAEWLAGQGVKQAHVAGVCVLLAGPLNLLRLHFFIFIDLMRRRFQKPRNTYTLFFFNGGVEKQFEGEERFMIPSPGVRQCSFFVLLLRLLFLSSSSPFHSHSIYYLFV